MKHITYITAIILALTVCSACDDGGNSKDSPKRIMLFSSNWGDNSIKITDNILSYDDGSTAVPREVTLLPAEPVA